MDASVLAGVIKGLLFLAGFFLAFGTILSWLPLSHWFIRGWDFPRLQIAVLAFTLVSIHLAFFHGGQWWDWLFVGASTLTIGWQLYRIGPYLPVATRQVLHADNPAPGSTIRMLASNVRLDNHEHQRLLETIRRTDPDVVLALEIDESWKATLEKIRSDYPYIVAQPQDNMYGMMLLSRLELIEPELRFMVQEDIPSIHTGIRMRNGQVIVLHGLHPRPPEPYRDQDSTPRDAELVIMGREVAQRSEPTIVLGDLNDVCWSRTTLLFLRLSQLMDPRHGRGVYNTFDANSYWKRVPLDHVFHSPDFKLVRLEIQPHIGSDHFPVLVELAYDPQATRVQKPPRKLAIDEPLADALIDREQDAKANGEDRPNDDHEHADAPSAPNRSSV